MALTKQAIDRVSSLTGQSTSDVRQLLEDGWTFSWNIRGEMSWTRNVHDSLFDIGKIPVGISGENISRNNTRRN